MKTCSTQTIHVNLQGDPPSLNPHLGIDVYCRSIQKALYEGLTRLTPDGTPELALAEKVEISPCHMQYTFTLRPSLWSNGAPVTAHHFASSWKRAIAAGSACLRADLFYIIKNAERVKKGELALEEVGISVPDEKTLVVELEHPTPYFLELVALPLYAPLYDEAVEPTVFNGPFVLRTWERNEALNLARNPLYWDASQVKLDEICFSIVNDPNTALLMYEKGELDWSGSPFTMIPPDILPGLKRDNKLCSMPVSGVYWFSCNTKSFPLTSAHIRKALAYSIDRQAVIDLEGIEMASRTVVPLHMLPLREDELYPEHNLEWARAAFEKGLQELKITKEHFPPLVLSYSNVPGQKHLAEAVARDWEKNLGIKIELVGSDWNTFFSNLLARQYQIGGCIWFYVHNDPIYPLEFFKENSLRYNAPQWENAEYKQLLDLANEERDLVLRKEYLKQAELILLQEMPVIPVYISDYKYIMRENLKDVALLTNGMVDFKRAYVQ